MALLPQDRQSQVMLLIFVAALAAAYFFWTDWAQPTAAKISAANSETDSLQVIIDKAKQDIASLPRIVVPQDVVLKPAQQQAQKVLGDTLGALLEAQFVIRTFVKSAAPPGPKQGAPVKRAAGTSGED